MCSFSPPDPPKPEPIPEPPVAVQSTTKNTAPKLAESTSAKASPGNIGRKRRGRGSLRIPLTSSGLSNISGLNFPTS